MRPADFILISKISIPERNLESSQSVGPLEPLDSAVALQGVAKPLLRLVWVF